MNLEIALTHLMSRNLRRDRWPAELSIGEWEEHFWVHVGDRRVAPWCPTADDLLAEDWRHWIPGEEPHPP